MLEATTNNATAEFLRIVGIAFFLSGAPVLAQARVSRHVARRAMARA